MKKLITACMLLFGLFVFGGTLHAQNGGGNGNSNGIGNSQFDTKLVVKILKQAQPHFNQTLGLSLGQLLQKYHNCECTITWLGENKYRVAVVGGGGNGVIVDIDVF